MKTKTFLSALALALALVCLAPPAQAQLAACSSTLTVNCILTPTTLSVALQGGSDRRTVPVASATNCTATNVLYTDRELMVIESVSGTTLTVRRGAGGTTATAHVNAGIAFCGPPGAFSPNGFGIRVNPDGNPSGACTRGGGTVTAPSAPFLPFINVKSGAISDCLGGVWQMSDTVSGTQTGARFRFESNPTGGTAYTSVGTDTALSATTLYCTEFWLPTDKLLTGIGLLNGATETGNLRYAILYDSTGTAIANSAVAGQATVTANVYENYPFTAKFYAIGPAQYFICTQDNAVGSTTARLVTTGTDANLLTKGQTSAVFGTIAALVVPTTFTSVVGPFAYVY